VPVCGAAKQALACCRFDFSADYRDFRAASLFSALRLNDSNLHGRQTLEEDWVSKCVAEAQAAGNGVEQVPDAVVEAMSDLLSSALQSHVRASDIRQAVIRLAKANHPATE
jgi:hypothetical protein